MTDTEYLAGLEQRTVDLENTLLRVAEVVAAQTFDIKTLAKVRRESLVYAVKLALETVEGDVRGIRQASYRVSPSYKVRARFPEDLEPT
jgi:hypothetical protein